MAVSGEQNPKDEEIDRVIDSLERLVAENATVDSDVAEPEAVVPSSVLKAQTEEAIDALLTGSEVTSPLDLSDSADLAEVVKSLNERLESLLSRDWSVEPIRVNEVNLLSGFVFVNATSEGIRNEVRRLAWPDGGKTYPGMVDRVIFKQLIAKAASGSSSDSDSFVANLLIATFFLPQIERINRSTGALGESGEREIRTLLKLLNGISRVPQALRLARVKLYPESNESPQPNLVTFSEARRQHVEIMNQALRDQMSDAASLRKFISPLDIPATWHEMYELTEAKIELVAATFLGMEAWQSRSKQEELAANSLRLVVLVTMDSVIDKSSRSAERKLFQAEVANLGMEGHLLAGLFDEKVVAPGFISHRDRVRNLLRRS